MFFELSIAINRSPYDVFAFLRDKEKYPQKQGSPVLALDKTTLGPTGVGTRYREAVQMLPLVRGEILSVITRFETGAFLEEDFKGAGMSGHLAYQFLSEKTGTLLVQRETLVTVGLLNLVNPIIKLALGHQLERRLRGIKLVLESGWIVE